MCKNGSVCLFEEASYLVLNFRAFNSLGRFLVLCHSTYYKVEGFLGGSSQLGISVQGLLALLLWAHGLAERHGRKQAMGAEQFTCCQTGGGDRKDA